MNSTVISGRILSGAPVMVAFPPALVQNLYSTNFNIAASSALFFWDALLTLDKEVKYIWRTKFSWINVFFWIIRFLAIGGQLVFFVTNLGTLKGTEAFCRSFIWFRSMLGVIMFVFVDVVLILRLFAFYGSNKALLISLLLLECLAFGGVMGLGVFAINKTKVTPNPVPHDVRVGICIPLGYPDIEPDIWIPLLAVQGVLFFLAIGRHVYERKQGLLVRTGNITMTSNIYQVFIRDGVWVFSILFFDLLLCVIGNALHEIVGAIAIQWSYAVIGVSVSRLILNLRHAAHKQLNSSHLTIPNTSMLGRSIAFAPRERTSETETRE